MATSGNGERRLAKDLLDVYERSGGKLVRPLDDPTDTEYVRFGINIIRAEINAVKKQLKADVWLVQVKRNTILNFNTNIYYICISMHTYIRT